MVKNKGHSSPGQEKKPREHDIQIGHVCRGLTRILQSCDYTRISLVGLGKTGSPRKSQPGSPRAVRLSAAQGGGRGGRKQDCQAPAHILIFSLILWEAGGSLMISEFA